MSSHYFSKFDVTISIIGSGSKPRFSFCVIGELVWMPQAITGEGTKASVPFTYNSPEKGESIKFHPNGKVFGKDNDENMRIAKDVKSSIKELIEQKLFENVMNYLGKNES